MTPISESTSWNVRKNFGNKIHSDQNEKELPAKVANEAFRKTEVAANLLEEKEKPEAEEKIAWQVLEDSDTTDFTNWTQLLQFVDGKN